jgi:hypothetical protein
MHVHSEQLNGRNLAARRWTVVDTHACQTVHGGYGYGRVNWRNIAITLIEGFPVLWLYINDQSLAQASPL